MNMTKRVNDIKGFYRLGQHKKCVILRNLSVADINVFAKECRILVEACGCINSSVFLKQIFDLRHSFFIVNAHHHIGFGTKIAFHFIYCRRIRRVCTELLSAFAMAVSGREKFSYKNSFFGGSVIAYISVKTAVVIK